MKIISIHTGSYASNCYCLISEGKALVADPSVSIKNIMNVLREENAVLAGILLTHGHFDHLTSVDALREACGVPAYIHRHDADYLSDPTKNCNFLMGSRKSYKPADVLLEDGGEIALGGEKISVIHTPGHTEGSACYLYGKHLITGDTLFADTVGRCDLYGGNPEQMRRSIEKLAGLDPDIDIYPGHGRSAKLGDALETVKNLL